MSLPEITDEDRKIASEAFRLWRDLPAHDPTSEGQIAAALVRTGWKPVDPDLILAREVCAELWISEGSSTIAEAYTRGDNDHHYVVRVALAAIKAVRREGERKG